MIRLFVAWCTASLGPRFWHVLSSRQRRQRQESLCLQFTFRLCSHRSGNASVVVEESSSGVNSSYAFAADGDLATVWEASTSTNEWVTLDIGDAREVTALRLQVWRPLEVAARTARGISECPNGRQLDTLGGNRGQAVNHLMRIAAPRHPRPTHFNTRYVVRFLGLWLNTVIQQDLLIHTVSCTPQQLSWRVVCCVPCDVRSST